jgi:hypothetical protein
MFPDTLPRIDPNSGYAITPMNDPEFTPIYYPESTPIGVRYYPNERPRVHPDRPPRFDPNNGVIHPETLTPNVPRFITPILPRLGYRHPDVSSRTLPRIIGVDSGSNRYQGDTCGFRAYPFEIGNAPGMR